MLTPKNNMGSIKRIAVAAVYSKPNSRKKTATLDHICGTYNQLKAKYNDKCNFVIAGDTNDLNLTRIINLNSNMKQTVTSPTRHNPDRILDPIITDLSIFYQTPIIKPPLDPDPDGNGQPSDHNIVVMPPINNCNLLPSREKKIVTYRPMPRTAIEQFGKWIQSQTWEDVYDAKTPTEKTKLLQEKLNTKFDEICPKKKMTITTDDEPWVTHEIKGIERKMKREFWKRRKTAKFKKLKIKLKSKVKKAKSTFYQHFVSELKETKLGQWYGKMKRIAGYDQVQFSPLKITSLEDLPNKEAADKIADAFSSISQKYSPLKAEDLPAFLPAKKNPSIQPYQVHETIQSTKKTKTL